MMLRQRKQKLTMREEVSSPADRSKMEVVTAVRDNDPFLPVEMSPSSPSTSLGHHTSALSPPETPGDSYLTSDELGDAMATFLDAMPPTSQLDMSPYALDTSPIALAHDTFSKEVFQDLRHTSTPKWRNVKPTSKTIRKRIHFSDHSNTSRVLQDITASFSTSNGTFINPLNSSAPESGFIEEEVEDSEADCENSIERVKRVPIIRKNIVKKSTRVVIYKEFSGGWWDLTEDEKKKIVYYTGVNDFEVLRGALAFLSIPTDVGLSQIEVELLTLMRLRLYLEWKDLAFRFNIQEAIAVRVFLKSLGAMAGALRSCIPWQDANRKSYNPITLHVHPIYFKDESVKQILVCMTEEEVVFVSSALDGDSDVGVWWNKELKERMRAGDTVVYSESKMWHVIPGGDLVSTQRSLPKSPSLLKQLSLYKMFEGKFSTKSSFAHWVMIVISALVNLDNTR